MKRAVFFILAWFCVLAQYTPEAMAFGSRSAEDTLAESQAEVEAKARLDAMASATEVKGAYWRVPMQATQDSPAPIIEAKKDTEEAGWLADPPVAPNWTRALASTASTHAKAKSLSAIDPTQALAKLRQGNTRFHQGRFRGRKEGATAQTRDNLSHGQKPYAVLLSCSDSRVPPEIVFDQRLGEVFVVRSAGQSLDQAVIASVEYGVEHLGARLVLVMGHESCGAVHAAVDAQAGKSSGSPHIDALIADIQPRLSKDRAPASKGLLSESAENARGVVRDLLNRSELIRGRVSKGEVEVRSALYRMSSGKVDFD